MLIPFLIPFVIAIFLAINMGGSGTAPAFSAAYGCNILKASVIPGLFGIMVFLGAIFGGEETANTIGKGLLNPAFMNYVVVSIILLSVALSLLLANIFGVPQSTSQSTVLAVIAPALYFDSFNSDKFLLEILPSWFITPLLSFILALIIGKYIYKPIRKKGYTISKKFNESNIIRCFVIFSSLYVAFSIGANNVANAVGPIATMANNEMNLDPKYYINVLILSTLIVAPSFAIGSSIFGKKLLKNTGKDILAFGKFEAVIISLLSASILLLASLVKGIPTSLVQLNVAAILGIGVSKIGYKNVFQRTQVRKFFVMWCISPIVAFIICFFLCFVCDKLQIINN